MRVGLVGLDSTHADHFVHDFNVGRAFGPFRIEALCGDDGERAGRLAESGGVPLVVDEPDAMLGRVDAVIVGDRDGRLHLPHAMPFLRAGMPVLIDKPLATHVADAVALIETAQRHRAPLTSLSALRWAGGLEQVRVAARDTPPPHVLQATGPADPASPWGGLSYYGVHMVEAALAVTAGPIGAVVAFPADGSVVATTTIGATRVVFTFVRPTPADSLAYQLQLVTQVRIVGGELTLNDQYLRPVMAAFVRMAATGEMPLSFEDLLAPVIILERIDEAVRRTGAPPEQTGR